MKNHPGIIVLTACSMLLLGACENKPKTEMGALIGGGALGASAIAKEMGIGRASVYRALG